MNARRLRKKINPECKDISIQVSYGTNDVRETLKQMFRTIATPCGESFALSVPIAEPDLLNYFERTIFQFYEAKTAKELSRWAVTQAIKREFVIKGSEQNTFYLSPILKKRAGRPKREAEE